MAAVRVLITGVTGYIGRRLASRLLARPDLEIRVLVRNARRLPEEIKGRVEVVEGDTFDNEKLARALKDIEVAFYLIHSMGAGRDFVALDRKSAGNFRDGCIEAGVGRIIYLGGLGVRETASKHLLSRLETGEVLSARPDRIVTIWIRAGVIIGAGSKSFEIIRGLVKNLPLMVAPRWVSTRTQPIGVNDVLSYLVAAIRLETRKNLIVDIGSAPMTFREMIQATAKVMRLSRFIVSVPVLTPKLSSYWLILFTPVDYHIAAELVEGLKSETVQQNDHAARYFPEIKPRAFEEAVRLALAESGD